MGIRIWHHRDYSCTHTSHEYWMMHVIFDHSHVTVHNVQACSCCQQDLLQVYIGWLLSYLSSADALLAVNTNYKQEPWVTVWYSRNCFVHRYCSSGTQVSRRSSNKTVIPSASGVFVILWCIYDNWILQLSHETFWNLIGTLPTQEQWKSTVWTWVSYRAFFF